MRPIPNFKMKSLREERQLTQVQVAKILEIPVSSYAMIEAGHRLNPRRGVQIKIARFYGCTIDELFFNDLNHEVQPIKNNNQKAS